MSILFIRPVSIIISTTLLLTLFTIPAHSNNSDDGAVIEDKDTYPLYQYSQLIEHDGSAALVLNNNRQDTYSIVVNLLKKTGISYQIVSESPALLQTDWISWHFDANSKKTLSNQSNRFFSLNTRDKYKFRISIKDIQQHPAITLDKINREQQVDITPDTEMVWLKWKAIEPDAEAVKAFMQRLQTEYEIQVLESNKTVINSSAIKPAGHISAIPSTPVHSNNISLNLNISQAWALVIKQLKLKSVPLASVHNDQHMLNSKWLYAKFNNETKHLDTASKETQRHQFQLLVIPGSTNKSSLIFVYHTAFQQNSEQASWSDKETQQEIAGAFLDLLDLKGSLDHR